MTVITRTKAQVSPVFQQQAEILDIIASVAVEAGEAVTIGTDGQLDLAIGNTGGNAASCRGIALQDGAIGDVVPVLKRGGLEGFAVSALDADAPVFVSATAGELDDSAAAVSKQVGVVYQLTNGDKIIYIDVPWNN
jgi:hypothetical protein